MSQEILIEHEPERRRFVLKTEGGQAELTYRLAGRTIILDHTGVPAELQHRGLANRLAVYALDYAREQNLQVIPECRFVQVYLERHPQYADLLQPPKDSHSTGLNNR